MKKLLILSLLFVSCGKEKVQVSGSVDVNHNISIANLQQYFAEECKTIPQTDPCYRQVIDECVNCKIADFIDKTKI